MLRLRLQRCLQNDTWLSYGVHNVSEQTLVRALRSLDDIGKALSVPQMRRAVAHHWMGEAFEIQAVASLVMAKGLVLPDSD